MRLIECLFRSGFRERCGWFFALTGLLMRKRFCLWRIILGRTKAAWFAFLQVPSSIFLEMVWKWVVLWEAGRYIVDVGKVSMGLLHGKVVGGLLAAAIAKLDTGNRCWYESDAKLIWQEWRSSFLKGLWSYRSLPPCPRSGILFGPARIKR